jgi:hypothetical protein
LKNEVDTAAENVYTFQPRICVYTFSAFFMHELVVTNWPGLGLIPYKLISLYGYETARFWSPRAENL